MEYKINKESVDKVSELKIDPTSYVEITEDMLSESKISLTDLIMEARKQALKEDIKANTVMISKRLAKVNRFVQVFPHSYADFPPLICGLEAFVTDEMPEEFAFGLVEAPMTQREAVFEDGRMTGYNQGYKKGYEQGVNDLCERLKNYYGNLRGTTYAVLAAYHIEEAKKELLKVGKRREDIEKSPVDSLTPSVTDSKGEEENEN